MVTHNTSLFAEHAVRSIFAANDLSGLNFRMHVLDNASRDQRAPALANYLKDAGVPLIQTGLDDSPDSTKHAAAFEKFVRENPGCSHYLFLDPDIWFEDPDVIPTMVKELETAGDLVFGNQAQNFEYFENKVIEGGGRIAGDGGQCDRKWRINIGGKDYAMSLAHRCSPACCLIKNTPTFRRVVEIMGLGAWWTFRAPGKPGADNGRNAVLYDTFSLMTHAMKTHGLEYMISSARIMHYTNVAWRPKELDRKEKDCLARIERFVHGQR